MKLRQDLFFLLGIFLFFLPFIISEGLFNAYYRINLEHGLPMSFIKFFFLATLGELIGLRIKTGRYYYKGFGLFPRAIVWGCLGISIYMAFAIFASGTPVLLEKMGNQVVVVLSAMAGQTDTLIQMAHDITSGKTPASKA